MHPADIQAALKRKKITQKEIAKAQGVSEMAVSLVVNKRMVSDKLMKAISEKIERDPLVIFSEYYLATTARRKKAA